MAFELRILARGAGQLVVVCGRPGIPTDLGRGLSAAERTQCYGGVTPWGDAFPTLGDVRKIWTERSLSTSQDGQHYRHNAL